MRRQSKPDLITVPTKGYATKSADLLRFRSGLQDNVIALARSKGMTNDDMARVLGKKKSNISAFVNKKLDCSTEYLLSALLTLGTTVDLRIENGQGHTSTLRLHPTKPPQVLDAEPMVPS